MIAFTRPDYTQVLPDILGGQVQSCPPCCTMGFNTVTLECRPTSYYMEHDVSMKKVKSCMNSQSTGSMHWTRDSLALSQTVQMTEPQCPTATDKHSINKSVCLLKIVSMLDKTVLFSIDMSPPRNCLICVAPTNTGSENIQRKSCYF
jgi:hypothetical protein